MSDVDFLASAHAARAVDLAALDGLTADQVDYLERLDEIPDPSGEGVEHGDGPYLTDSEWRFVLEVSGGR